MEQSAGPSSHSSQKAVVSDTVARSFEILSADIPKAYVQGVSNEELADLA